MSVGEKVGQTDEQQGLRRTYPVYHISSCQTICPAHKKEEQNEDQVANSTTSPAAVARRRVRVEYEQCQHEVCLHANG